MTAPAWNIETAGGMLVRRCGRAGGRPIWFIHGFADSGLAFMPLMQRGELSNFELFAPDLPGFGCSPPQPGLHSCDAYGEALVEMIARARSGVHLVCHSTGSIVATRVAEVLGRKIVSIVSVEGNLTCDDAYWTGRVASFDSAERARSWYCDMVWARAGSDPVFRRYIAGVVQADALSMWRLARSVVRDGSDAAFAHRLVSLGTAKLYYWRRANTALRTQEYLDRGELPNLEFFDCGHWPMIEQPDQTAAVICSMVQSAAGQS